jgi:hypothetical protein
VNNLNDIELTTAPTKAPVPASYAPRYPAFLAEQYYMMINEQLTMDELQALRMDAKERRRSNDSQGDERFGREHCLRVCCRVG